MYKKNMSKINFDSLNFYENIILELPITTYLLVFVSRYQVQN